MKSFDYDSHTILGLIKHDFIQENNWTVEPYFDTLSGEKRVHIIWHPSTLVYNYLALRQQKIWRACGAYIFRIYRMNQGGWRQDAGVTCSNGNIIINWIPYRSKAKPTSTGLSASRINKQISGLTAQLVQISLYIPYWDGLSRKTRGAHRWSKLKFLSGHDWGHDGSDTLYWKTLKLRCFVSSHRGVYQRNKLGNIVPLTCSCGISPGFYKKHNRGGCRFTIQTDSDSKIGYSFKARTWGQYVQQQKEDWKITSNNQNQILWYESVLLDASTKQPVMTSDYIISGHVYIPASTD